MEAPLDAPAPPAVTFRAFDDIDGQRNDIYNYAQTSIKPELSNASHKLTVTDIGYDDDGPAFSIADEKDAILKRRSLHRPLKATLGLYDTAGNKLDEQRMTVAHVPHMNSRGLFIRNGVIYAVRNQLRLRPGIYTRRKRDGGIESHFNVKPGTGRGFRVELEPETGLFKVDIGQSKTRLYPIMRAMGVTDDAMKEAWGEELFNKNFRAVSGKDDIDLDKVVRKLGNDNIKVAPADVSQALRDIVNRTEVDEDTTELTLGQRIKNISPAVILQATAKQLKVASGEDQGDNRDSQAYQSIHSAEDLIGERLKRDPSGALRKALWLASRNGNLKKVYPGLLNDNITGLFEGSGLSQTVEDVNPFETHDLRQAISRLGEGGMSSDAVSRDARNVQASYLGVIDSGRGPESSNLGVDLRVTDAALKGSDNQLYTRVKNLKTGQVDTISARELSKHIVAFPGEMGSENKRVAVVRNDKMTFVPKEQVEYEVQSANDLMSRATAMIPFPEGIKGQRLLMGARHTQQALPLAQPEAPMVQTAMDDGSSMHANMGKALGAKFADDDGVITNVTADYIEVATVNSGKKRYDLYNNYPLARKTSLNNTPVVNVGDPVTKGQVLAKSNYTDDKGVTAIGKNLRVAYMSAEGNTIEDAVVISESAAKKLAAEQMYKSDLDLENIKTTKKDDYTAIYADKFKPEQLDKLSDDGIANIGQTVQPGDPLILGVSNKQNRAIGAIMDTPKSSYSDATQLWDHHSPGVVTDITRTKTGIRVSVKTIDPVSPGDKLSNRFAAKGVVSRIIPDEQMPVGEDGQPVDVILNAFGTISRVNPAALVEALLGKVSEKSGKPYVIKGFSTPGITDWALNEAEKYGIKETETVTDPRDNRKIPNIFVGKGYFMRLQHKAEEKLSARDQAGYTVDGFPAKGNFSGAKRISLLDTSTLIAAGATEFLKDAKLVRGQRNDDYWRSLRNGDTPQVPDGNFADDQFKTMLKGAGVNIKEEGTREQLRPLLDKDVDDIAQHEVDNGGTFDFESMEPIEGGLFDLGRTGGASGNRYTKIVLPAKIPHPLFLDPIQRLLGLTGKGLTAVLTGKEKYNDKTGPQAIEEALGSINLDREMEAAKADIKMGRASRRDAAVKKLHYLAGLKKMGVNPADLMVSRIAVVPPRYRPVVTGGKLNMVHDLNYLYNDLIEAKKNYVEAGDTFGESGEQYDTLLKSVEAIYGTGDPVSPKTAEQGVKGILRYAIGLGASPKHSIFQRRVIGTSVDTIGRAVITADSSLGMDELGIPANMAWEIFRPFIIRRLVRNGAPAAEALLAVRDRTEMAKKALEEELLHRPVVYNRAPALHRYAYQGAMARLVDDDAIHVPYATMRAQGNDNDGDQEQVHVPSSEEAIDEIKEKLMPSKNLFAASNFETHYEPVQDYVAGLYLAGNPDPKQALRVFRSAEDAKAAYARGEITARTPIKIIPT